MFTALVRIFTHRAAVKALERRLANLRAQRSEDLSPVEAEQLEYEIDVTAAMLDRATDPYRGR